MNCLASLQHNYETFFKVSVHHLLSQYFHLYYDDVSRAQNFTPWITV